MFKDDILYHLPPKKRWMDTKHKAALEKVSLFKDGQKNVKRIYHNVPSIFTLSHSSKNRIFGE